jgi:hypothetical protein
MDVDLEKGDHIGLLKNEGIKVEEVAKALTKAERRGSRQGSARSPDLIGSPISEKDSNMVQEDGDKNAAVINCGCEDSKSLVFLPALQNKDLGLSKAMKGGQLFMHC